MEGKSEMRLSTGLASALALMFSSHAAAQETRIGEEGFESPSATLEQVDWLVGQWAGPGIQGAPAMESWLPPMAGTMVGTFVQETGEGGIMFTEHMYLTEQDGSLVVKLKHFNADLTSWEDKEGMVTFRLLAVEDCAAYFHGLTLRCDGEDGLLAAVRMKSAGDNIRELVFRFTKQDERMEVKAHPCADAVTTPEMGACYSKVLKDADDRRRQYLSRAVSHNGHDPRLADLIRSSDAAFEKYRDAECGDAVKANAGGSIAGVTVLSCRIALTDKRTHTIWGNWLLRMNENDPPVLPEPKPSL